MSAEADIVSKRQRRQSAKAVNSMRYVYFLRSRAFNNQTYIGQTSDIKRRLLDHNEGKSSHTAKFIPWELVAFVGFQDACAARNFEDYLKTGSGRAFAQKHFWNISSKEITE